MKLYIFNPEHDIALASNLENFTAPHAGRELRHDLGYLPALWAEENSYILVNDIDAAKEGLHKLGWNTGARFIDSEGLKRLIYNNVGKVEFDIQPWGWDIALRHELRKIGVSTEYLPSNGQLNIIRQFSHRAWASEHLLRPLTEIDGTVGTAESLLDIAEVKRFLSRHHDIVLKAPWSSSGRGIRYVSDHNHDDSGTYYGLTPQIEGWLRNVINRQGGVMAEPYYNKVADFGMEFSSDGKGNIEYKGLSAFHTTNGAYTGNIIEDEDHKLAALCRFIPQQLYTAVRHKAAELLSNTLKSVYAGPLGIDMMVVRTSDGLKLHPCVEMNLRMTMGHVALFLNQKYKIEESSMHIGYLNGRYILDLHNQVN